MRITIRPLETHDELRACEDVQREAWGMIERDVVPMHLLVTFLRYGGLVLGAFDGERVAGFVYGFPGLLGEDDERARWLGTRVIHCSEMLGVRPEYQGRGIGYALKCAQRDHLLARGTHLVTWTFDPLMSRNAHLNLARLGGVCRELIRNAYGDLSGINSGLTTDRFELEWWIGSQRVAQRIEGLERPNLGAWRMAGVETANPSRPAPGGLRAPPDSFELTGEAHLLIEIPGDFQAVKQADMGLARAWQAHARAVFEAAFEQGYAITEFASEMVDGTRRSTYVLQRGLNLEALARGEA